jgi:hypothetical protein
MYIPSFLCISEVCSVRVLFPLKRAGSFLLLALLALSLGLTRGLLADHAVALPACGIWTIVRLPGNGQLLDVSTLATNNAWAVGETSARSPQALIEHWNGRSWTMVPGAIAPGVTSTVLSGVSALAANNVWAVGGGANKSGSFALIEHWNGSTWTIVPAPTTPARSIPILIKVSAVTPDNIWAAGFELDTAELQDQPLVEHWDGSQWNIVPLKALSTGNVILTGISAISANDVWAVGVSISASKPAQAVSAHWDGSSWSTSTNPTFTSTTSSALTTVATSRHGQILEVGDRFSPTTRQQTLIESPDASGQWRVVSSPSIGSGANTLSGVAIDERGQSWAVGNYMNPTTKTEQTLIEQSNDAGQWQIMLSPNTSPTDSDSLNAVSVSRGLAPTVWAVGSSTHRSNHVSSQLPLSEVYHSCALPRAPGLAPAGRSIVHGAREPRASYGRGIGTNAHYPRRTGTSQFEQRDLPRQ